MFSRLLLVLCFILIPGSLNQNVPTSEVHDKENVTGKETPTPPTSKKSVENIETTKSLENETVDSSVAMTDVSETTSRSTEITHKDTQITSRSAKISPEIKEKVTTNGTNHAYNFGVFCIILTLILVAVIIFLQITKLKKDSKKMPKHNPPRVYIPKPLTPEEIENALKNHIKIAKGEDLLDNITKIIEKKDEVRKEFRTLNLVVKDTVTKTMTSEEGRLLINKVRNRYNDIIPFDSNRVILETPIGDPPSTYINASPMKFSSIEQTFISAQAPRPNTFGGFWQMVLENNIHTVVMITDLIEAGRRKAEKYWPDQDDFPEIPLENDIKVKYVSDKEQGTYLHRTFIVTDPNNQEHEIDHLQTTSWKDMQAPNDTNVLLDLLYKVEELATARKGPILVHCSAGVGRTGTFIALYKLIQELAKDEVNELDLFMTTLQMRKQRSFMIQKAEQYMYVFKCLHKYVADQMSVKKDVIEIKDDNDESVMKMEPGGDNESQTLEDSGVEKEAVSDTEDGIKDDVGSDTEKGLESKIDIELKEEVENGVCSDVEKGCLNIMSLQLNGDEEWSDQKKISSHNEDSMLIVD